MNCINCQKILEPNDSFCSTCGNKVVTKRITIKHIADNLNQEFFNYDNKLLITFWHLLIKPEVVIDSFISGVRKRYVNVISYLALSLTLAGFQIFLMQRFFPESLEGTPPPQPLDPNIEAQINLGAEHVFDFFGVIVILSIPVVAIGTYVVMINKKHNYAEHIVLNMYVTAQYSILMFFMTVGSLLLGFNTIYVLLVATIMSYIYIGYSLKRVYQLSILGALWRTAASQLIYMTFLGILAFAAIAIAYIVIKI